VRKRPSISSAFINSAVFFSTLGGGFAEAAMYSPIDVSKARKREKDFRILFCWDVSWGQRRARQSALAFLIGMIFAARMEWYWEYRCAIQAGIDGLLWGRAPAPARSCASDVFNLDILDRPRREFCRFRGRTAGVRLGGRSIFLSVLLGWEGAYRSRS